MILLIFYIFFGVLAFFYELANGSGWKFSLFIAIFYPLTMAAGAVGWVVLGIYQLIRLGLRGAQLLWSSKLFQRVRLGLKK